MQQLQFLIAGREAWEQENSLFQILKNGERKRTAWEYFQLDYWDE